MRVAILGNSGSGKSSLAATLAAIGRVPRLDLDTVAWDPDPPAVPREEALALRDVHEFCSSADGWVVEGSYATLVGASLAYAPKLIFLNPGLEVCLANCRARPWEPHKYASKQEQDDNLALLLSWVAEYYTRAGTMSLAAHVECFRSYAGPKREIGVLPSLSGLDTELLEWVR